MHFDLHPSTNAKERNTSYLIRTVSFVLTVLYVLHKIILGEGSQGSNSQSCSARPQVVDRGKPLDRGGVVR